MLRWVISVAVLLAFAAAPASADVDAYATIYKTKDITVTEDINITKTIDIDVEVTVEPVSVAEAFALLNQTNVHNHACTACAEKADLIQRGANSNSGIVTVNQAAGNNNNQGHAIAISIDDIGGGGPPDDPDGEDGFAHAQAHVDQKNAMNRIDAVELAFRDADILGSFNFNSGVIFANQSVGNNNNQGNALAMGASLVGTGVALAEADLGQVNKNNNNFESQLGNNGEPSGHIGINKTAFIGRSIIGNSGIVGVNQSAGNNGNQANVVSFAFATSPITD
jgi:hypothetical protein